MTHFYIERYYGWLGLDWLNDSIDEHASLGLLDEAIHLKWLRLTLLQEDL